MKAELLDHLPSWAAIKHAALTTVGKDGGRYPSPSWRRSILLAEHSPIRRLRVAWRWTDLPYWVSVHMVRHKIGIEHWVRTQRSDRTGVPRDQLPQGALVEHECEANAQAMVSISRKRLCSMAAKETREAWQAVKDEVAKVEPELASVMVRECIYRGFCPEMHGCGYAKTEDYKAELAAYRGETNEK